MAMENVLVKKLGIIDTLGCVSTIASDKVGREGGREGGRGDGDSTRRKRLAD